MMTEMTKTPSDTPTTDATDAALAQTLETENAATLAMDRDKKQAREAKEAAKLAAAYDAAKGPAKIDWTRPTAGILDQTERRNNPQYFQADTMAEAMQLATAEADKIVAATARTVGVFVLNDVRVRNEAPAQSMALAWKGGEA